MVEAAEPVVHAAVPPRQASSTVLVVDDEESIRRYLANVLRLEGYECLCFSGSLAALAYLAGGRRAADLMLADISMPEMNGMELLREAKELKPDMPVIMVSGLYELALALEAIEGGADDYLRKPVSPSDISALVGRYLRSATGKGQRAVQEALQELTTLPNTAFADSESIRKIFRSLGAKRFETFQHSKRVAAYARLLGERAGVPPEDLPHLELGAMLHDIGKVGVPRNILLKAGPLTPDEWDAVRTHPTIGYRMMESLPNLAREADVVYAHHERFDGGGYPRGLAGEAIPLWARLFSIVDTLDAMTSDRPYRPALPNATAKDEIRKQAGAQFDPRLVDQFLEIPDEALARIRREYPDPDGDEPAH